jgi:hypothetical protein
MSNTDIIKGFGKAQRAHDNASPEEFPECPICGAELDEDGSSFRCTECDYYSDDEPDCDPDEGAPEPECWAHGMDA